LVSLDTGLWCFARELAASRATFDAFAAAMCALAKTTTRSLRGIEGFLAAAARGECACATCAAPRAAASALD